MISKISYCSSEIGRLKSTSHEGRFGSFIWHPWSRNKKVRESKEKYVAKTFLKKEKELKMSVSVLFLGKNLLQFSQIESKMTA